MLFNKKIRWLVFGAFFACASSFASEIPMQSNNSVVSTSSEETSTEIKRQIELQFDNDSTDLIAAVVLEREDLVKKLIEQKVDVNKQDEEGNTALLCACDNKNSKIAQLLLDAGANPNLKNNLNISPLLFAVFTGNKNTIKALIAAKADIDIQLDVSKLNQDVLKNFFRADGFKRYSEMISFGDKATLLIIAIRFGLFDVANVLIDAGADLSLANNYGFTPLLCSCAIGNSNEKLTRKLIDKGASISQKTFNGVTPLMMAAHERSLSIVTYLLQRGASINETNQAGNTALNMAMEPNNFEVLKFLIDKGGKFNVGGKLRALKAIDVLRTINAMTSEQSVTSKSSVSSSSQSSGIKTNLVKSKKQSKKKKKVTNNSDTVVKTTITTSGTLSGVLSSTASSSMSVASSKTEEKKIDVRSHVSLSSAMNALRLSPASSSISSSSLASSSTHSFALRATVNDETNGEADNANPWIDIIDPCYEKLSKYARTGRWIGDLFMTPHAIQRALPETPKYKALLKEIHAELGKPACQIDHRDVRLQDIKSLLKQVKPKPAKGERLEYADDTLTVITESDGVRVVTAYWNKNIAS